jgi:hypothetical protein
MTKEEIQERLEQLDKTYRDKVIELDNELQIRKEFLENGVKDPWLISHIGKNIYLNFKYDTIAELKRLDGFLSDSMCDLGIYKGSTTSVSRIHEETPAGTSMIHTYSKYFIRTFASDHKHIKVCCKTDAFDISVEMPTSLYEGVFKHPTEVDTTKETEHRYAKQSDKNKPRFYIRSWQLPDVSRIVFMGNYYVFYAADREERTRLERAIFQPQPLSLSSS